MIPPSFVITLKDDLGKQEIALNEVGIFPEIFKGVDGRKDEYKHHEERISNFCNSFCTKSMKGSGLSHMLLNEKIYNSGIPIALILEDDAYPIDGFDISKEIDKVLQEVPDDWDIIRLHCDAHCKDGSNSNDGLIGSNASAAAYLVNSRSSKTISDVSLLTYIDVQQNALFKIYKSKTNLFFTDESTSMARNNTTNPISPILDVVYPIKSGQKTWDMILSMGVLQVPYLNIVVTSGHIINFIIILLLLFVLKKRNNR
jgi:GR25 family glycosyltransferase involved in LPS biosynthesis